MTDGLASSLPEFIEAVERIQRSAYGVGSPQKKRAEWTLEFLRILSDAMSRSEMEGKVNFVYAKMVRAL